MVALIIVCIYWNIKWLIRIHAITILILSESLKRLPILRVVRLIRLADVELICYALLELLTTDLLI